MPMIKWSLGLAVAATFATVFFAWLGGEASTVTPTATSVASSLIQRVVGGLSAGLG